MKTYYQAPDRHSDDQRPRTERRSKLSNHRYFRIALTAFLTFVCCTLFVYLIFNTSRFTAILKQLNRIMTPVYIGLIIAYLLTPIVNKLEHRVLFPLCTKWKIPDSQKRNGWVRAISIFVTIIIAFLCVYGIIYLFLSQIIPSIYSIVDNFDTYVRNITNFINANSGENPEVSNNLVSTILKYSNEIETWFNENVLTKTTTLIRTLSMSVLAFLKGVLHFIVGLIISIYVLGSKEKFVARGKKIAYSLFSREQANEVITAFRFTHKTFSGFITGKVIDSVIIGLICFICTTIMQTPYASLVSLIVGVTNLIPFFGPWIGGIPCTLLIFMIDPMHPLNALYFLIFIIILQQFDGNILGPKILGDYTGLTGFWVIFAITFFGGALSVFGMVIGVPAFAVIYAGIKNLTNNRLREKGLPWRTEDYMNLGSIDEDGTVEEYVPDSKKPKNQSQTEELFLTRILKKQFGKKK